MIGVPAQLLGVRNLAIADSVSGIANIGHLPCSPARALRNVIIICILNCYKDVCLSVPRTS